MLFRLLFNGYGNFVENLFVFLMVIVALVISISIHEFSHAAVALWLGDNTAKLMGRVTLNPKSHLDPVGFLLLIVAGFGWGRPVPFNPINFKVPKRDIALVSFAGPASNILFAVFLSVVANVVPLPLLILVFLRLVVSYNLILAIFNLIPVNPLDGYKIVNGLLSPELSQQWLQLAPYGIWILLALIFAGVVEKVVSPLLDLSLRLLGF